MSEQALRGLAASPGVAVGRAHQLEALQADDLPHRGHETEANAALAALDAEADALLARAERLRDDGLEDESEILTAGRLMALGLIDGEFHGFFVAQPAEPFLVVALRPQAGDARTAPQP